MAENQPRTKHRVTCPASQLASGVRSFIHDARGAKPVDDEARFHSLAREVFFAQFHSIPVYRRLCEARGVTPDGIATWQDIPAIPTSAFKEFELTCLAPGERTAVFHSSGTTGGVPSRHFHGRDSLALYEDSAWRWFEANVKPMKSHGLLVLTPPPEGAPQSSLVHMFDTVRRKLDQSPACFLGRSDSDGAWHLDTASVESSLEAASASQTPVLILGTAFSFVHLLDSLAAHDRRFALAPGSRVMETGGYKGRSRELPPGQLHKLIARHLGVRGKDIIREYGMSELSSQAYDTPQAPGMFRFPPWARAIVISPETGREVADRETGLLRVVDLANVGSVMAIQTEDLAVRHGDGFELLGRAVRAESRGCSLMAA